MWFMWCRCMRNCHGPVELCSIRWCPRPSFWIPPLGQCSRRLPWLRLGWTVHGHVFNCGLGQAASNKARMKSGVRSHGQRCNQVHEAIIGSWSRKPIWFSPLLIAMLFEHMVPSKCDGLSLLFGIKIFQQSHGDYPPIAQLVHVRPRCGWGSVWLGIETDPRQGVNFDQITQGHRWNSWT